MTDTCVEPCNNMWGLLAGISASCAPRPPPPRPFGLLGIGEMRLQENEHLVPSETLSQIKLAVTRMLPRTLCVHEEGVSRNRYRQRTYELSWPLHGLPFQWGTRRKHVVIDFGVAGMQRRFCGALHHLGLK